MIFLGSRDVAPVKGDTKKFHACCYCPSQDRPSLQWAGTMTWINNKVGVFDYYEDYNVVNADGDIY